MAKTEYILLTVGTGATSADFVIKGVLKSYEDVAAVALSGFTAAVADAAGLAKVLGVVTPITAMLESGSFRRIKASTRTLPKKSRDFIVPVSAEIAIRAAIHDATGLSIDGITCTSASEGLRRVAR